MGDKKLPDGVPCNHPGCLHHVTHPCEGCGRIAGHSVTDELNRLRAELERCRAMSERRRE